MTLAPSHFVPGQWGASLHYYHHHHFAMCTTRPSSPGGVVPASLVTEEVYQASSCLATIASGSVLMVFPAPSLAWEGARGRSCGGK